MAYVVIRAARSEVEGNHSKLHRDRVAAEAQAEAWRAEGFVVTLVDTEACSVENAPPIDDGHPARPRRWSAIRTTRRGANKVARSA